MGRQSRRRFLAGVIVFLVLWVGFSGCSNAESEKQTSNRSAPETSMKDVEKEANEAAEAVKNYAGQQKDQFMDKAKTALDEADQRISSFRQEMQSRWDEMDKQAREKAEETLKTMKEKREVLKEKLEQMKKNSAEAWGKMKKDLQESYEALKKSMESTDNKEIYI